MEEGCTIDGKFHNLEVENLLTAGEFKISDSIALTDITLQESIDVGTSATIGTDLTVDTNTLVVNSTNNNVGIGVDEPISTLKLDVSGNVRINGDLEVIGTTTSTTEEATSISAPLQQLGTGTIGQPSNDSGIVIERGDEPNVFMGWDESENKFIMGIAPNASNENITADSSGDLTLIKQDLQVSGIIAQNLTGTITTDSASQPNITGVGTITSGTWQGTSIDDNYISSSATWNSKQDALTFGISDGNVIKCGTGIADDDFLRVNGTTLEGISSSELKTDIGLDNVENTAISTWSGSTLITTLGTITSGTWNGSTIGIAYGGTGSTTASGARTAFGLGTEDSPQFTSIKLGHASDTIITRDSAGVVSIAGNEVRTGTVPTDKGGTGEISYTNGKLLIGNSSGGLTSSTLSSGSGISITNGDGSITISSLISAFTGLTDTPGSYTSYAKNIIQVNSTADGLEFTKSPELSLIGLRVSGTNNQFTVGVDDNDDDKFKIGTTTIDTNPRLTIDSAGNVGIGNSSPGHLLDVAGDINLTTTNDYKINDTSVLNETTLGSNIVNSSLTSVGDLDGGSITSNFGDINIGTSTITCNSISGTLTTPSQTNITSVGTLNTLDVTDDITISGTSSNDSTITLKLNSDTKYVMGIDRSDGDKFKIGTSSVDTNTRLSIDTDGNVGIGTNNPVSTLQLKVPSSKDATDSSNFDHYGMIISKVGTPSDGTETGICFDIQGGADPVDTRGPGAAITHERTGTWSQGKLHFKTKQSNVNDADCVTAMTVAETGNVGIGKTNPSTLLELSSNEPYLTLTNTTEENTDGGAESKIIFNDHSNTSLAQIQVSHDGTLDDTKGDLIFSTNDGTSVNEALRIDSSGNVGIGTTGPTSKLQIEDSTSAVAFTINNTNSSNDSIINFNNSGSTQYSIGYDSDNSTFQICNGNFSNSSLLRINQYNKITIGSSNTDYDINDFNIEGSFYFAKQGSNFDYSSNDFGGTGPNIRIGDYMYLGHTRTNNIPYIGFNGYLSSSVYVSGGTSYNKWRHKYHNGTNTKITLITANITGGISIRTANTTGNEIEENGYATTNNFTNIVQIGDTGNVGIGTTSPSAKLHIHNNGEALRLQGSSTGSETTDEHTYMSFYPVNNTDRYGYIGYTTSGTEDLSIWNQRNGNLKFSTNNTEIMRISNSGNVGIGTNNPTEKLEVNGKILADNVISSEINLSDDNKIIANRINFTNVSSTDITSNIVLLEIFANTTSTTYGILYAGSIDIDILGRRAVNTYSEELFTTKLHFSLSWRAQAQTFTNNKFILENKTVSDGTYDTYTIIQGIPVFKYKYDNSTKKFQIYTVIQHDYSNITISYSANVSSTYIDHIYIPSSTTLMSTGTSYDIEPSICYDNDGNVGIGTANAIMRLDVRGGLYVYGGSQGGNGSTISNTNSGVKIGGWLNDVHSSWLYWYYGNNASVRFSGDTNLHTLSFTGQHICILNKNVDENSIGLIVSSSGKYINLNNSIETTINECLPICNITKIDNDIKVFGVISDKEDTDDNRYHGIKIESVINKTNKNEQRMFINSLGEGAIWVCNKNGNLVNGDYISSSSAAGYGMRQNTNKLLNSTVAKITCDCDFSLTKIVKQKLKVITTTETYEENVFEKIEKTNTENVIEYDEELSRYVQKEITNTTTEEEQVYDTVDLYNEDGEVIGTHQVERKITKTKIITEIDYDDNGNVQYEDDLDENGNQQMIYPYETRFLLPDGTQITEEEYSTKKSLGEIVYLACFVGCTYHCG